LRHSRAGEASRRAASPAAVWTFTGAGALVAWAKPSAIAMTDASCGASTTRKSSGKDLRNVSSVDPGFPKARQAEVPKQPKARLADTDSFRWTGIGIHADHPSVSIECRRIGWNALSESLQNLRSHDWLLGRSITRLRILLAALTNTRTRPAAHPEFPVPGQWARAAARFPARRAGTSRGCPPGCSGVRRRVWEAGGRASWPARLLRSGRCGTFR
jgi:hypothetical protein